ncbi:hypothetical protein BJY01DRAFT_251571 [Aspergillus pseudoustus]|uniref:DUF7730 domain-containing protein n=1 Tax=Aspergillus pseudoustus TaxID=1810923 RepID=A0ABR4JB15_9EURO
MALDSFLTAMNDARSLNPVTVFRTYRNPLHVAFLFVYYLILVVGWILCAIGLTIFYPYICIKSQIQARYFPPPKESANGEADLPAPLKPRKRRLTLPLSDDAQRKQTTFLQHQSLLFLKLPAEVRRVVYLDVICLPERAELCVSHANRRLYSFPAGERDEENPDLLGYPHSAWVALNRAGDMLSESIPRMVNSRPAKTDKKRRFRVLGLLSSCRRIYSEAIDLLYQETNFNVRSPITMLSLQATTLPERFASIRYLHVEKVLGVPGWLEFGFNMYSRDDWENACAAIGTIRDLRCLRVSFSRTHCEPSQYSLVEYMDPLMTLNAVDFVVRFNWAAHATVEPILAKCQKKLPFKIDVHPGPPEAEARSAVADE